MSCRGTALQVVMKSKIIASDKDSVGIVFFGAVSSTTLHYTSLLLCEASTHDGPYVCIYVCL